MNAFLRGGDNVVPICAYEGSRLFRDKLVGSDNKAAFDNIISTAFRSDWSAQIPAAKEFGYFVSFGAPGGCSPGAPVPHFGKPLGHLTPADLVPLLDKGITRFCKSAL